MADTKPGPDEITFSTEDFQTYNCPHCGKPIAKGILYHLKMNCPNCNKLVVIVGLSTNEKPLK
ncbi:MAG: hypothetical protein MJE63_24405 [Proteobacteria bacterium]|nr:hypothetical protein [Pseudomonadota bacterium]